MTGAQLVVKIILEQGTDTVFGLPGGSVLPIFDVLYNEKQHISLVLTSHEQTAAHAADGYARASGKVGVCIATSGPGATNLVTGIAAANMDSSPTVFIVGNIPSARIGTDCFQEVDIVGITIPITKHNYRVRRKSELEPMLRQAFAVAKSGRPGAVVLDIPFDIQTAEIEELGQAVTSSKAAEFDTSQAVGILSEAARPVILAGGGVHSANAEAELLEFSETTGIPVVQTLMGLGSVPNGYKGYAGMAGVYGHACANELVSKADVIIAIGCRFSDRTVAPLRLQPDVRLIHIDIDRSEIGKMVKPACYILGDARAVLSDLAARLCGKPKKVNSAVFGDREYNLPTRLMSQLSTLLGGDTIFVTDVGQHQIWAATALNLCEPRSFITSGGAGVMGFGMGAAVGVQIAQPHKKVVLITGDGSFSMNGMELSVVSRYSLPLLIVIMNNHALGMVRQLQTIFNNGRHSASDIEGTPDFVRLAESFGITARRVENAEQLDVCTAEFLSGSRPMVLECVISPEETVQTHGLTNDENGGSAWKDS